MIAGGRDCERAALAVIGEQNVISVQHAHMYTNLPYSSFLFFVVVRFVTTGPSDHLYSIIEQN